MASDGAEETAPTQPSPKKPPKKEDVIKSKDIGRSSEVEETEVNPNSDYSTAPTEDHAEKRDLVKTAIPELSHPNELLVRAFDRLTGRRALEEYFAKYGKVTKVSLPWSEQTRENKGFGFVCFESAASLQSALAEDHEIDGKKIGVKAIQAGIKEENTADHAAKMEESDDDDDEDRDEDEDKEEENDDREDGGGGRRG